MRSKDLEEKERTIDAYAYIETFRVVEEEKKRQNDE